MMNRRKSFTPGQALEKIRHFCAYQERSHFEVSEKLYSFGLNAREVDSILAELIGQDYLNEERFATMFAGGKFRVKKWGRKRIEYELRARRVSEYNIRSGMAAIDPQDYHITIGELIRKKKDMLIREGYDGFELKARTLSFLSQRGFESALVQEAYNELSDKEEV
jgi:regulatory protein